LVCAMQVAVVINAKTVAAIPNITVRAETLIASGALRHDNRMPLSIQDPEIRIFTHVATPTGVDLIDSSRARSLLRPSVQVPHRSLFALSDHLQRSIRAIAHPTTNTETASLALGRGPEVHPLHSTSDDHMQLFKSHSSKPVPDRAVSCKRPPHRFNCFELKAYPQFASKSIGPMGRTGGQHRSGFHTANVIASHP
jgi:hypothetical protein